MFMFTVRNYKYTVWQVRLQRRIPLDVMRRWTFKKCLLVLKLDSEGEQLNKNKIHFDHLLKRTACEAATHSWMDVMAAKQ